MCYVIIQKKPKCIHVKKTCHEAIALIQEFTKAEGFDASTIASVCQNLQYGDEYHAVKYSVRLQ